VTCSLVLAYSFELCALFLNKALHTQARNIQSAHGCCALSQLAVYFAQQAHFACFKVDDLIDHRTGLTFYRKARDTGAAALSIDTDLVLYVMPFKA
jgi:hypothetical protein